jgi:hypothetical protein
MDIVEISGYEFCRDGFSSLGGAGRGEDMRKRIFSPDDTLMEEIMSFRVKYTTSGS